MDIANPVTNKNTQYLLYSNILYSNTAQYSEKKNSRGHNLCLHQIRKNLIYMFLILTMRTVNKAQLMSVTVSKHQVNANEDKVVKFSNGYISTTQSSKLYEET